MTFSFFYIHIVKVNISYMQDFPIEEIVGVLRPEQHRVEHFLDEAVIGPIGEAHGARVFEQVLKLDGQTHRDFLDCHHFLHLGNNLILLLLGKLWLVLEQIFPVLNYPGE